MICALAPSRWPRWCRLSRVCDTTQRRGCALLLTQQQHRICDLKLEPEPPEYTELGPRTQPPRPPPTTNQPTTTSMNYENHQTTVYATPTMRRLLLCPTVQSLNHCTRLLWTRTVILKHHYFNVSNSLFANFFSLYYK